MSWSHHKRIRLVDTPHIRLPWIRCFPHLFLKFTTTIHAQSPDCICAFPSIFVIYYITTHQKTIVQYDTACIWLNCVIETNQGNMEDCGNYSTVTNLCVLVSSHPPPISHHTYLLATFRFIYFYFFAHLRTTGTIRRLSQLFILSRRIGALYTVLAHVARIAPSGALNPFVAVV